MSGLASNELTMYLRPMWSIQPYQVTECATWLVSRGDFKTIVHAKKWLIELEEKAPWEYKGIMSSYFKATDYAQDYTSKRDVNKYRSSATNYYGEDSHMYY